MSYKLIATSVDGLAVCPCCGYAGPGVEGAAQFCGKSANNAHLFHMHRYWAHMRKKFGESVLTYVELQDMLGYMDVRLKRMQKLSESLLARYGSPVKGIEKDVEWMELVYLCNKLMLLKFNQSLRLNDYASWDFGMDLNTYTRILWSSPLFRLSLSQYISPLFVLKLASPYQVDFCIPNDAWATDWVRDELIFRRFAPTPDTFAEFVNRYESKLVGVHSCLCTDLAVCSSVKEVVVRSMLGASGLGRPKELTVKDILDLNFGFDLDEAAGILNAVEDSIRAMREAKRVRVSNRGETAVIGVTPVFTLGTHWLPPTEFALALSLKEAEARLQKFYKSMDTGWVLSRGFVADFFTM